MDHALRLAARGLGHVWPNPAVGCVILSEGRVVGRGWTQPGGRPHAEARALAQAGEAARGATAYVTLEPCAHHGQTPPCAGALAAAGVARVVSALTDPDPRVSGRGHDMLRAARIAVTEGVREAGARRLNAGFFKRIGQGLPFVTLKLATTLDGRIATASGESRWITGPEARRMVHVMRGRHDAVMVGSGTARADDPDLGVRELGPVAQPVRILVDSGLRHASDSRLGRLARTSPVWVMHGEGAAAAPWQATGARLFALPLQAGHIDLRDALSALAAEGITRIFCEGGAGLGAALLRVGLVDELVMFGAGRLIGEEGRAALGPLGVSRLDLAPHLRLTEYRRVGADVLSVWRCASAF
ncbi:MAG: bifunctional diaminohydroxyphosphoribosylaminopyrimidine deaminase/5-amino-6-(5-phosphoribosylamino)uracil reductase RibD [Pseudorhodobacter sp.]